MYFKVEIATDGLRKMKVFLSQVDNKCIGF